jgi:hypothetical protein
MSSDHVALVATNISIGAELLKLSDVSRHKVPSAILDGLQRRPYS